MNTPAKPKKTLRLTLSYHWYQMIQSGEKRVEYREITPRWTKLIWDKRDQYTHICFSRGYSKTTMTFEVTAIDVGTCPIPGWDNRYFRIFFQ
tara:strand:- start:2128 stop:2403 length:276 start_codon:yes stop_codon:yes gene_type:complete